MFGSRNKRRTRDGTPIWYVFIDESGHPYWDDEDVGPFTMAAIVTDDPGRCSKRTLAESRRKDAVGGSELKSSRASRLSRSGFIGRMRAEGYTIVLTTQPLLNQTDDHEDVSTIVYLSVLSRLLNRLADEGPDGIYRVYVDDSEYADQRQIERVAHAAFDGVSGKALATHKPASKLDSEFSPPVQAADMVVGGYRKAMKAGNGDSFASEYNAMVANRKSGIVRRSRR